MTKRFHMMFVKWSSFATPKIELLLFSPINLLLCTSSPALTVVLSYKFVTVYKFTCPDCGANYVGKTERTLYEGYVEHKWNDQNSIVKNHLHQCVELQYLLNITGLGPSLFLYDNNIVRADNRNSHVNLVIDNTNMIDHHKNFKILFFEGAIKINERKPTLNTGLKASKKL